MIMSCTPMVILSEPICRKPSCSLSSLSASYRSCLQPPANLNLNSLPHPHHPHPRHPHHDHHVDQSSLPTSTMSTSSSPFNPIPPLCQLFTAQITLHRKQTRPLPNSHVGKEICETNLGILLVASSRWVVRILCRVQTRRVLSKSERFFFSWTWHLASSKPAVAGGLQ